jgi:hypothetical protein
MKQLSGKWLDVSFFVGTMSSMTTQIMTPFLQAAIGRVGKKLPICCRWRSGSASLTPITVASSQKA